MKVTVNQQRYPPPNITIELSWTQAQELQSILWNHEGSRLRETGGYTLHVQLLTSMKEYSNSRQGL